MNCSDLESIDVLVGRNSNLLTAFKLIDDADIEVIVENIKDNIANLHSRSVK